MKAHAAVRTAARRRAKVEPSDRLKLAEALLASDDVATCAQRALDWLGRTAGVTRALCLVGDADNITLLLSLIHI